MKKPTFGKLFVAYLVDLIALQVAGFVLAFIVSFCVSFTIAFFHIAGDFRWLYSIMGLVIGLLFNLLYFAILESRFGYSLGKKLMGLQVVQNVPNKPEEQTK